MIDKFRKGKYYKFIGNPEELKKYGDDAIVLKYYIKHELKCADMVSPCVINFHYGNPNSWNCGDTGYVRVNFYAKWREDWVEIETPVNNDNMRALGLLDFKPMTKYSEIPK